MNMNRHVSLPLVLLICVALFSGTQASAQTNNDSFQEITRRISDTFRANGPVTIAGVTSQIESPAFNGCSLQLIVNERMDSIGVAITKKYSVQLTDLDPARVDGGSRGDAANLGYLWLKAVSDQPLINFRLEGRGAIVTPGPPQDRKESAVYFYLKDSDTAQKLARDFATLINVCRRLRVPTDTGGLDTVLVAAPDMGALNPLFAAPPTRLAGNTPCCAEEKWYFCRFKVDPPLWPDSMVTATAQSDLECRTRLVSAAVSLSGDHKGTNPPHSIVLKYMTDHPTSVEITTFQKVVCPQAK